MTNYMQGFPALQGVGQAPNFGDPAQLAQALQMFKGGANTLSQAPTIGNHQAQEKQQAESLAAMMEAYKRAQSDQQFAGELMRPEYAKNSGALGAIAMIMQTAAGRRMARKADETASQYAERIFAEQQRLEQEKLARDRAQADADAARAHAAQVERRTQEAQAMGLSGTEAAEYVATGKVPRAPDAIRTLQALQQNPELAALDLERKRTGAPRTTVNMPGQNAFDVALGKADAQTYVQLRNNAGQAQQALNQLANVEEILSLQQTGKAAEAAALIGQYFGTEGGANMQSLKMAIQPLVLAQVKQLGTGAGITDADRRFIEAGMPGFGNDPRANERGIRIMRQAANANISLFDAAQQHRADHGTLATFNPATVLRAEAVQAPEQGQPSGPRQITTQAEYDALPSGATYIDPDDGKTYRKP